MLPDPVVLSVLTTRAPFAQCATISPHESMCPTVNPLRLGSSGFVAIDDNFAAQVAAFGDRLRDCVKRYGHQGRACSRLAHGDGPRSRAGLLDDGRDLRGTWLPHTEENVVSGGGPALAQRGTHVSYSDNGDLHHGLSRLARGRRPEPPG